MKNFKLFYVEFFSYVSCQKKIIKIEQLKLNKTKRSQNVIFLFYHTERRLLIRVTVLLFFAYFCYYSVVWIFYLFLNKINLSIALWEFLILPIFCYDFIIERTKVHLNSWKLVHNLSTDHHVLQNAENTSLTNFSSSNSSRIFSFRKLQSRSREFSVFIFNSAEPWETKLDTICHETQKFWRILGKLEIIPRSWSAKISGKILIRSCQDLSKK